jgi:hypothetical protein
LQAKEFSCNYCTGCFMIITCNFKFLHVLLFVANLINLDVFAVVKPRVLFFCDMTLSLGRWIPMLECPHLQQLKCPRNITGCIHPVTQCHIPEEANPQLSWSLCYAKDQLPASFNIYIKIFNYDPTCFEPVTKTGPSTCCNIPRHNSSTFGTPAQILMATNCDVLRFYSYFNYLTVYFKQLYLKVVLILLDCMCICNLWHPWRWTSYWFETCRIIIKYLDIYVKRCM